MPHLAAGARLDIQLLRKNVMSVQRREADRAADRPQVRVGRLLGRLSKRFTATVTVVACTVAVFAPGSAHAVEGPIEKLSATDLRAILNAATQATAAREAGGWSIEAEHSGTVNSSAYDAVAGRYREVSTTRSGAGSTHVIADATSTFNRAPAGSNRALRLLGKRTPAFVVTPGGTSTLQILSPSEHLGYFTPTDAPGATATRQTAPDGSVKLSFTLGIDEQILLTVEVGRDSSLVAMSAVITDSKNVRKRTMFAATVTYGLQTISLPPAGARVTRDELDRALVAITVPEDVRVVARALRREVNAQASPATVQRIRTASRTHRLWSDTASQWRWRSAPGGVRVSAKNEFTNRTYTCHVVADRGSAAVRGCGWLDREGSR